MRHLKTVLILATLGFATAAAASPTTDFLEDAIKGDNSEIKFGALAMDKGRSADIKAYGKMLQTDHSAHKAKLVAAARPLNMSIPDGMTVAADAEYLKLKVLSGDAFDKEFARHMVSDHREDIAKYEKEAARNDPATAKLAKATVPTLKKHLATAEKLAG
jgi:putative membrane protein